MNDKQVEAFLCICETGSMNRAAEKLFISQPALKKRIDTLEGELGVPLLARTSEGCAPTQAGRVFLEGVAPMYAELGQLIKSVRGVKERQTLRVCTLPDISMAGQDELLIAFSQANPDVLIEWIPLPTSDWLSAVDEGRADLCSCLYMEGEVEQFKRKNISIQPVDHATREVCVMSQRHPLARKHELTMDDLRGHEVYAGPLLYHCGGLREYAQREGLRVQPDDNAGKRYEVIEKCERGAVYIHAGDYADNLRPLAVRPLLGYTCRSCWVWNEASAALVGRFLSFIGVKR